MIDLTGAGASPRNGTFTPTSNPYQKPTPARMQPGYVYLLHGENTQWYKIGISNDPSKRLKDIGIKLPFPCQLLRYMPVKDMRSAEKELHQIFADKRTAGEWFILDQRDIWWLLHTTALTAGALRAEWEACQ